MLAKTQIHSGWEFIQTRHLDKKVGFSKTEWLPATVPGHIHADLVDNGVIAHPFGRMAEMGCQWVDDVAWSYRTTLARGPKADLPRRKLVFHGLDTLATVFLNDEKIAESNNMFVPLEVDVTDLLKEGDNELRIDFASAVQVGLERQAEYFEREKLAETVGRFGERAFVRKAQYMYGWDWGPRLVSCGVWKPVELVEYAARILDVHVHTAPNEDGTFTVKVTTEVEGEGQVVHTVTGPDGDVLTDFEGDGSFVIEEPELWEPNGVGDQPLYSVETALFTGDDEDQTLLDFEETGFGLKVVRLLREPDAHGQSFEFEVNGRKLWIRGANWIPDHSLPGTIEPHRLRDRLEKCVDMGFNMLRVWGGGLYESDDFYNLCDELGILVWQDFPFACGFYPDTDEYVEPFRAEAVANVKRIRNHASLAIWCGNNENHQCFADRWAGDGTPPRFYGEHFYHGVIPEVLAELDPGRDYTPGSACGPTEAPLEHVNQGGFGDSHYWDVWHGRGDWRFYADSTARFSSEFGFCSSPSLEVWQATLDEEDWAVHSPAVRWHDKTGKGYDTFVGFVKLHYPDPETLEDWVYYSQLNQRDALRFGIEHFRRSDFCRGTLVWQINDCWPVQSWAMMDSFGNYKALGYESRRLYADVLFSLHRKEEAIELWGINDGPVSMMADVEVAAYSTLTGERVREFEAGVASLEPDTRYLLTTLDLKGLNVNETIVVADAGSWSAWQLLGEPKNTRFAKPGLITVSTAVDGYLHLRVDGPVFDLMLTDEGSPAPFKDNFITLPAGGDFMVEIGSVPGEIEARSLAGLHPIRVTRAPL